jgi:hypothetical protein
MATDHRRRRARRVVAAVWAVVQVVVFLVVFAGCGFAGLYLGLQVPTGPARWGPLAGMVLGFVAGMAGALGILRGTRVGLLRLRLRRLRRNGTSARATVMSVERRERYYGRGGYVTTYTVTVRWGRHGGERRYSFPGKRSDRFTEVCHQGAVVSVWHPAGAPDRFVIDIPFTPVLEDLLAP